MQQGLVLVVITIQFKECVFILVTELLTLQNVKFNAFSSQRIF